MIADLGAFRKEFVHRLTIDSEHRDRRRNDYNQALFDPDHGTAIYTNTDLLMILRAFDDAVHDFERMHGK